MAYYSSRQINKMVKDAIDNYCPPSTYKNKMPTEEEFGVQDIDIDQIEKERNIFMKKKEKYETLMGASFIFGCLPALIVSSLVGLLFELSDNAYMWLFSASWLFLIVFFGIMSSKKYPNEKTYEKAKKYTQARSQYYWWQERKKKDFWIKLDGRKFEIEIARIFKKLGYKTKICKQGGDEGVDLEIEKEGVLEIVQCKAHKAKVSPSVARDLLGTMLNKKVNHSYLVTLNGGTTGTIDFCKKNNITLWDIDDIIRYDKM